MNTSETIGPTMKINLLCSLFPTLHVVQYQHAPEEKLFWICTMMLLLQTSFFHPPPCPIAVPGALPPMSFMHALYFSAIVLYSSPLSQFLPLFSVSAANKNKQSFLFSFQICASIQSKHICNIFFYMTAQQENIKKRISFCNLTFCCC